MHGKQKGEYAFLYQGVRWPNTVSLYPCAIHRYFQTIDSWAAKIGKLRVQLTVIIF